MNNTLSHTWSVLDKKEKKQFVMLILSGIIISIADIFALVALLWIVNLYIQPGDSYYLSYLPGWAADKNSMVLVGVFVFLFALKNIAGFLVAKAHYTFTGQVAVRISCNNLVRYQQASFAEFVTTDSSVLIRKIALQPFEFSQHVLSGIQQIIIQLSLISISIIAIIIFNAKLFLLLLAILLPPVVVVFYFIKKRLGTIKKNLRESNERSYQYLLDALKGYVEANIYQRNDFFLQRFLEQRSKFSTFLFSSLSLQNLPGRIIEIFAVLGLFILILIAKWTGNDQSSTLLTIGAFMAAAYKIIPGIVKVINLSGQIKAYDFSADELVKPADPPQTATQGVSVTTIQSVAFNNISFQYADRSILGNLSFSVQQGDFLGISGDSGIGKTTIINLLLGFLQPVSGNIMINGLPLDTRRLKKCWPFIAYARQQSFFIYDTIVRNITLEEKDYDKSKLDEALHVSGLDKLIAGFPGGLQMMITENGKNISGGQQQRVAIARALYKDADLLLLDEPFNELDDASVAAMLRHLRKLCEKGKIIIMITHDKQSLAFCNKTISLDVQ